LFQKTVVIPENLPLGKFIRPIVLFSSSKKERETIKKEPQRFFLRKAVDKSERRYGTC